MPIISHIALAEIEIVKTAEIEIVKTAEFSTKLYLLIKHHQFTRD
jgi:hypothetical protein